MRVARPISEQITQGNFLAEIIHDPRLTPLVYHCIVRDVADREILRWYQTRSLKDARHVARSYLAELAHKIQAA